MITFTVKSFVSNTDKKKGKESKYLGDYESKSYPAIKSRIKLGTKNYTVNSIVIPDAMKHEGRPATLEVI